MREAVLLPRKTVSELTAVALACKDNILIHVGPRSAALGSFWRKSPITILISVRDDGRRPRVTTGGRASLVVACFSAGGGGWWCRR